MSKKKKIVFIFLPLALVTFGACCLLIGSHHKPIRVVGNLTPKEVAEISSAVHREMWHSTFSGLSWKTIPSLPMAITRNITAHISGIYGDSESAFVIVANSRNKQPTGYFAQKRPTGWVCGAGVTTGF
jgi:hypothetical protein